MTTFNYNNYELTFKYQYGNETLHTIEYKNLNDPDPSIERTTTVALANIFINSEPAKDFNWRGKVIERDHLINCEITEGRIDLRLKIEVSVVDYKSGYMEEPILIDGSLTIGELKEQLHQKYRQRIRIVDFRKAKIKKKLRIQYIVNLKKSIFKEIKIREKTSTGEPEVGSSITPVLGLLADFSVEGKDIREGLNIQTCCNNIECRKRNEPIYVHKGMIENFNKCVLGLNSEDEVVCAECNAKYPKPIVDLIFYKCSYSITGRADHHEKPIEIKGETNSENQAKSCEKPRERIVWKSLNIVTKPLEEKKGSTENSSFLAKLCNII